MIARVAHRTFLVTGGAGFIGSGIVRALVSAGARVRVLDDMSRGAPRRLTGVEREIEVVNADVRDPGAVRSALRGCDGVFHLAYVNGTEHFYSRPDVVLDVAVSGMLNVIHGSIAHGVGELVLASSSEVYQTPPSIPTDESVPLMVPDPLNPRYSYGGGKIVSELLAINFGRRHFERVLVFRPHNVYGPDMGWEHVVPQLAMRLADLAEGSPGTIRLPIEGSGRETRSFVFIDDLVDGVVRIAERGEHLGIYNVGTQDEIAIADLAREIGACFGRDVEVIPSGLRPGSTIRRCPDITRIRALGYEPRVPLRDGLSRTVDWYRTHRDDRPGAAASRTATVMLPGT